MKHLRQQLKAQQLAIFKEYLSVPVGDKPKRLALLERLADKSRRIRKEDDNE